MRFWKTGCSVLDELLGGGIPHQEVTGIFGSPEVGKSWLVHQIAATMLSQAEESDKYDDQGLLIVDTEVSGGMMVHEYMNDIFQERFGNEKTPEIYFADDLKELLKLFHLDIGFKQGDSGKIEKLMLTERDGRKNPPYDLKSVDGRKKDWFAVIIDSLSRPLKGEVGTQTKNLPARADIVNRIYHELQMIARKGDTSVVSTYHVTSNPTQQADMGRPTGGDNVFYNTKFLVQLFGYAPKKARDRYPDRDFGDAKALRIYRHPLKKDYERLKYYPVYQVKDYGFVDVDEYDELPDEIRNRDVTE